MIQCQRGEYGVKCYDGLTHNVHSSLNRCFTASISCMVSNFKLHETMNHCRKKRCNSRHLVCCILHHYVTNSH